MSSLPFELQGESLLLHAERALSWPRLKTVLVADVHLGKEHVFGRQGVPIPTGPSDNSLERLSTLVEQTAAERLIVLGDLMHATPRSNESWIAALATFLDNHSTLEVTVCAGNHDKLAGQERIDRRIHWHNEVVLEPPFVLQHHPGEDERGYALSGHLHPMYRLGHRRRSGLRLPAFWFRKHFAVLPAFGSFTGGHVITRQKGDRVCLCGPQSVVEVGAST